MSEGSVGKQVVVGVTVAVLAAIILAAIGLNSDGSATDTPTRIEQDDSPTQSFDVSSDPATICDIGGATCPIMWGEGEKGDPCTCTDAFGTYTGVGR